MFINCSLCLLFPCISSTLFCYNSTTVSNSKTTQKHPELKYFINIHNWCQTRFRIKTSKSPETEIHITEPLLVGDLSAWQPTRLTKNPQAKKPKELCLLWTHRMKYLKSPKHSSYNSCFFFHFVLVSNLQSLSKLLVLNGNKNCVEKFEEIIFLYNVVLQ